MTDYILEHDKGTVITTYSKSGKLKKVIAKKGFLADASRAGHVFAELERDIELEYWKKYEPVKDPFFAPAQKEWLAFYTKQTEGLSYMFTPADGKALKEIGKHLTSIAGVTNDAIVIWKQILQRWNTLDPFYRHKMQLNFVNANLNTILNLVKNGKQTSAAQRSAADDLRRGFKS
ncbi:hypothetical protein [Saccharicrinis fermentans]|uniref:hypothetical protein n=2 Tax=Saccharicrinis fermentans TaxID=982 RepID=UPI0004883DC4|nr:hypothetical protein [Saccharicrinis fermentans]